MKIGDRVIWLGARGDGWTGNGKGRLINFEPTRRYFTGGPRQEENKPPVGPAVCVLLDGGDESADKKFEVWLAPSSKEIVPDPDFPAQDEEAA